jgi:phosphate transport system substrate-binding protein
MKNSNCVVKLAVLLMMVLVPAFCLAGDLDAFKGEKQGLKISGGTAHIPVMEEAAKRIMSFNPDIQITIAGGGSGAGIKQVGEGLVDIGNSGRKATDEEIAKYGLVTHMWAIDGVAPVVNPKNKVKALSKAQLQDIYAGKITGWKELGGEDRAINIYTRDESSGTREVFWEKALNKGEISGKANVVASNGAMKSGVANDPYAIGYMSVGYLDESVAPVALDAVTPSIATVKSGEYKVSRGLYSNTKGEAAGLVKKFIDYLSSPEGRKIVVEKGFIPAD